MATYKVIQDIEAEDKLVGPLALRQFIYAVIAVLCLYICFLGLTKHVAIVVLPIFLPVALITGFFAFPWTGQQPTEIWALAKLRFIIKPRRRIWDQSGIKELVTITVPKKVEENYSNGLSQTEVKSRLRALADTIDSRGWAIKNIDASAYQKPAFLARNGNDSDRLVSVSDFMQEIPTIDLQASDDIMDEQNNPVAHQFDTMLTESTKTHRQELMQKMNQVLDETRQSLVASTGKQQQASVDDYQFLNQQPTTQTSAQVVTPGTAESELPDAYDAAEPTVAEEQMITEHVKEHKDTQNSPYYRMHTIQPLSVQQTLAKQKAIKNALSTPVTPPPDPAIIAYANRNDLNVATIARQTHKNDVGSPDEVVISLH